MLDSGIVLRQASPFDAIDMVWLINVAGEGMPFHFWKQMAEKDADPWLVGMQRARRDEGAFSWRNATVTEAHNEVAALLLAYPIGNVAEKIDRKKMPPMVVPLQELENLALDTYYVNVLATYAKYRNRGHGSRLLQHAEECANGKRMSIIVSDGNPSAMQLYVRHGFKPVAHRPIVADKDCTVHGDNWILMIK